MRESFEGIAELNYPLKHFFISLFIKNESGLFANCLKTLVLFDFYDASSIIIPGSGTSSTWILTFFFWIGGLESQSPIVTILTFLYL